MLTARQQKAKANRERAAAAQTQQRRAHARLLGQHDTIKPGLNVTLHRSISLKKRKEFERIVRQLSEYTSAILDIGFDEAKRRLLAGQIPIGILRQAFAVLGTLGSVGYIAGLIKGITSGVRGKTGRFGVARLPGAHAGVVGSSNDASAGGSHANVPQQDVDEEEAAQETREQRLARMLHLVNRRTSPANNPTEQQLLEGLIRPGPDDRPLTLLSLNVMISTFFSGIRRLEAHGYGANVEARSVVAAEPAYPPSSQRELKYFAEILEKNGFLLGSKRRKHHLTPHEQDLVLTTLWKLPMPPIDRITLFFVLTLLEATGLRPGELFRFTAENDARFSEERTSPFVWGDVKLTYAGHRWVSRSGDFADATAPTSASASASATASDAAIEVVSEPCFVLQMEWSFGKNRQPGEIIPTCLTSQPIETSHHCAVRWILVLGMWLDVFEPATDAALRSLLVPPADGSAVAAVPPNTRLAIRKEWRSVPVLLRDRTILTDYEVRRREAHEMRLIAMSADHARKVLSHVANVLGWDNLVLYDWRRTFATTAKDKLPDEQLKLLMGHRRAASSTADSVYVSDHCPIDQSAIAAGGRWMGRLHSDEAQAAAGRSYGLPAPQAPTSVLQNPALARLLDRIGQLRNTCMADPMLALRIKRLALDLLNDEDWTRRLSAEQVLLVEGLQDAETEFLNAYEWATGAQTATVVSRTALPSASTAVSSIRASLAPTSAPEAPLEEAPAEAVATGSAAASPSTAVPMSAIHPDLRVAEAATASPASPASPASTASGARAAPATPVTVNAAAAAASPSPSSSEAPSVGDMSGAEWINELVRSGDNPVAGMTHAEFVCFVGSYLAVAETERQGLCPTCVDRGPTNEQELAIDNMGYRAAVTACTDQGLVYKHLSLTQMKEVLLLYQRRRQVPFMAMDVAQLRKLCRYARSASAAATEGEQISPDRMDHLEMIEFLTSFCGSPCAPNGVLNDASDWWEEAVVQEEEEEGEEEGEEEEEEAPASLGRTPLADTTNAAASSSSISAAVAAPRYTWSLDKATTKYEALRAALRAGIDVREQLDGKPINTATPAQVARGIADALRKPSFRPTPVPPLPKQPLAVPSQPSGTIEGVTPLSLRCHSLDPQRQGFVGIGRLGLLYTRNQFASRSHQLKHMIEHTEEVSPGFRFCWLCSSRFCTKEDADHVEQCRQAYFASRPRPLTLADFELHYRLPNATTILDVVFYIPLDVNRTVYSRRDHWQRQIYNLLTDTSVADPGGSKRVKWRLVRSKAYKCIVPYCTQSKQGLAAILAHLAECHRLPVVRRSGELVYGGFEPGEQIHEFDAKAAAEDGLLRLAGPSAELTN